MPLSSLLPLPLSSKLLTGRDRLLSGPTTATGPRFDPPTCDADAEAADSVAVVGLKLAADKVGVVRSEVTVRWVVEGGVPAAD